MYKQSPLSREEYRAKIRTVRHAIRRSRYTVRTRPYLSVMAAMAAGVAIGWLLTGRRG